ncbi:MAG: PIG-L deacetylase family protein [Thermomicrobium sp.]|nr:PIG-L deacetylase family protein [Thermomicrobium sp.]
MARALTPYQRVMVVVAHPDDMEFGAGGTVARLVREGKEVVLVQCTSGDKGTNRRDVSPEELARQREEEEREACRVLGVREVVFLRLPDGELEPNLAFRERIVRQIRFFRPDIVITHDPFRPYALHPDHRAVGITTIDAVYPTARDPLYFPHHLAEGLEPHKVAELWLFGAQYPDLYVDISETLDVKVAALAVHRSQISDPTELAERVRQRAAELGSDGGLDFAEAFKVISLRR